MKFSQRALALALLLPGLFVSAHTALAQTAHAPAAPAVTAAQTRGSINGVVSDPSTALVPGATVTLESLATHQKRVVTSNASGNYSFSNLAPGSYIISVDMSGFNPYRGKPITLGNAPYAADIQLGLASAQLTYEVSADVPTVDPTTNANSTTLEEEMLDTLPENPDDMLAQLQAIAGGTGAKLTVDGFDASHLPPKSSILQVRINSDPYSAENDTTPQNGTIQIITKPGVETTHGNFSISGVTSAVNAPNPIVPKQPPYNADNIYANLNGPVTKNSSYDSFLFVQNQRNNALIKATTLDSNNSPVDFTDAIGNPATNLFGNVRYKFQPAASLLTTIGYNVAHNAQDNAGVGQTSLRSYGLNNSSWSHTAQISNTWFVNKNVANITRIQFTRNTSDQTPVSTDPALIVSGAFSSGGNLAGSSKNTRDHYELQNYVMYTLGKHYLEFGGRIRSDLSTTTATTNFNGGYTFASLAAYQITVKGIAAGTKPSDIRAAGGGATQFTIAAGKPTNSASATDGGFFVQDDWKFLTNLTLSVGLRFETQSGIPDHGKDWAPRLGFSWGIDKKHNWTLRAGAGLFYSRFSADTVLNVRRQNGTNVTTFTSSNPDTYPAIPDKTQLSATSSSVTYQIAPNYRAPYQFIYESEMDRSLGKHGTLAFTARHIQGVHGQYLRNANAPLPGTYNLAVPNSGTCPLGCGQGVYQYDSGSTFSIVNLYVNANLNFGTHGNMFGNYSYRVFNSDSGGGFPSNQYNVHADYGRANGDWRNSFYMGYNLPLPKHFRFNLFMNAQAGMPFNITVGQDLNGDLQLNDRPAFATDLSRPSVVTTAYGKFDTNPIAGQTIIPFNYVQGPAALYINTAMAHTFNFFKEPPKPAPGSKDPPAKPPVHPYSLDLVVEVENPLNHPSFGNPVGVIGSPDFGKSISTSRTARQLRFDAGFRF